MNHWAFSADGSRVATASADRTAASGATPPAMVVPLLYHAEPVLHVSFHKDGRLIATGSGGGRGDIGEARTGCVHRRSRHPANAEEPEFAIWSSPATEVLLTVAYRDPAARIWLIPRSSLPADLAAIAKLVSGSRSTRPAVKNRFPRRTRPDLPRSLRAVPAGILRLRDRGSRLA